VIRAHLARQADLAENDHVAAHRAIHVARGGGDHDAEIGRRFHDASAARDVDEDVWFATGRPARFSRSASSRQTRL
jgi:hypothetical protein